MDERDLTVFLSESENAMNYGRIPISLLEILGASIIHCIYMVCVGLMWDKHIGCRESELNAILNIHKGLVVFFLIHQIVQVE